MSLSYVSTSDEQPDQDVAESVFGSKSFGIKRDGFPYMPDFQFLLREALGRLIVEEWDLAVTGASERTITSYLSRLIADAGLPQPLRADHDYNRHVAGTKRAMLEGPDGLAERPFAPDILIHQRGVDDMNLLAVEAKKSNRCNPHDEDKIRRLLETPFRYSAGVLIGLGMRTSDDQSWWAPSWSWLAGATDQSRYEPVFEPDACAGLNATGRDQWYERMLTRLD